MSPVRATGAKWKRLDTRVRKDGVHVVSSMLTGLPSSNND